MSYIATEFFLLPWDELPEDRARFNKVLFGTFGLFITVLFGSLLIKIPDIKKDSFEKLPPRIAKLIMVKKQPSSNRSSKVNLKLEKKLAKKNVAQKSRFTIKKNISKKNPKIVKLSKEKISEKAVQKAKLKASKVGIVALSNQLSALQNMASVKTVENKFHTSSARSELKTQDLISDKAKQGSGGISTTKYSLTVSTSLEGGSITAIKEPLDSVADVSATEQNQRSKEDIALVFDRYKSSFYSLYRRAARKKLGLQGRVVFRIKIFPNGKVSECSIVSSDLKYVVLENKLIARIKLMDFGKKDVVVWFDNFHIDFSPSG